MRSIRVIHFSGRISDCEGWSEIFFSKEQEQGIQEASYWEGWKYSEEKFELLLKLERTLLSQETQAFDLPILKQQSSDSSGLNKIVEIQKKLRHRFKRTDKRLRKEDLRRSV